LRTILLILYHSNYNIYTIGKWLVKLENKTNLIDITSQMYRNPYPKLKCQLQNEQSNGYLIKSSKQGISSNTVRMSRVHSRCTEEIIRLFFADYTIPNIDKLENDRHPLHPDKTVEYLIHFSTSYEAERAVRDKNHAYLYSFPIILESYIL
jgi:hypothetical protein